MDIVLRVRRLLSLTLSVFLPESRGVYYINGSDVLPIPLTPEEEAEAIARLADAEDGECRSTLVEHNLRLVVYIARRFENTGIGIEDLVSIGTIGLIKAVDSFDETRANRFATYAARCVENGILSPATFCRKHRPFALQKYPAGTS